MAIKFLPVRKKRGSVLGKKRYGEYPSISKPRGSSILGCRKYLISVELDKGECSDGSNKKSSE